MRSDTPPFAERRSHENFIQKDVHDGPMPLDFYLWLIRNGERNILVDTGFNRAAGERRNRKLAIPPELALEKMGVDSAILSLRICTMRATSINFQAPDFIYKSVRWPMRRVVACVMRS
jgi:hypothetical protein